jgi:hypothetical protein
MRKGHIILFASLSSIALAFLWEGVQSVRLGYEIVRTQRLLRRQEAVNAYLRMRLARWSSPERLAREAEARLRMTPPNPECQIILGAEAPRGGAPPGALSLLLAR